MWRASRLCPTVVLASAACALTSCAASPGHGASGGRVTGTSGAAGGLSVSAVVDRRFVSTVDLNGGDFVVQPPGATRARVSASRAQTMFAAADAASGDYPYSILGLGVVTVSASVPSAPDTLPGPAPPAGTGTSGTGASSSTSSTTTSITAASSSAPTTSTPASSTTTTASAVTTTTSAPLGVTTTAPAPSVRVPSYQGRLAWVGLAWRPSCGSPGSHAKDVHLVAVVFDAQSGRDVVAYTSGPNGCGPGGGAPRVSVPAELVSVPWQPVGPASTAVVATMPACATFYGWTELSGQSAGAVQVVARRPFVPDCRPAVEHTQVVDDIIPLGSGQARIPHAPLGPVDALQALPSR